MMKLISSLLAVAVVCSLGSTALAGEMSGVSARGWAWSRPGAGRAQSRMLAERGAQVVAGRNLLVREAGAGRYVARGRFQVYGVIRGHRYSPPRHWADGRSVVEVRRGWRR